MNISDEAVDAALKAAHPRILENLSMPFGASVRDHPDPDDLRVADEAAERANNEVFKEILRAALEAAAPHLLASVADEREGDLFRFTLAQREWLRSGAK